MQSIKNTLYIAALHLCIQTTLKSGACASGVGGSRRRCIGEVFIERRLRNPEHPADLRDRVLLFSIELHRQRLLLANNSTQSLNLSATRLAIGVPMTISD